MHYLSSREKKNGLQKDAAEDAHLIRAISLERNVLTQAIPTAHNAVGGRGAI